ncbi:MAG: CPBP family intramembrane metalloprotease [Mailhella sp.]|nr:CPBP family intramembrane metalloprotease [Mailhella sp.]
MRDPWLWGLFLAGVIGLFFSPQSAGLSLPALLMAALLEEAAFRALLQNYAEAWLAQKKKGEANEKKCPRHYLLSIVTPGNLAVSLLFAVVHALTQSPLMAALTFFPSLAMGILWTRHRSLWLCTGLHAWYNALFWW